MFLNPIQFWQDIFKISLETCMKTKLYRYNFSSEFLTFAIHLGKDIGIQEIKGIKLGLECVKQLVHVYS